MGSRPWQLFLAILWLEWVRLCISIMTTKQHYVFDLFSGIAVAHFVWVASQGTLEEIGEVGPDAFAEENGWNA